MSARRFIPSGHIDASPFMMVTANSLTMLFGLVQTAESRAISGLRSSCVLIGPACPRACRNYASK